MAGAALCVLSPHAAEVVEPIVVEEMLAEGLTRYEPDPDCWHSADGYPYGYEIQAPELENEPEWIELVEQSAGVPMCCDIGLTIFVNDVRGRPALGRMAERVARRTEGWVFVEFHEPPSAELRQHLADAGRCLRIDDGTWYFDASAMAAWNAHPSFHVV